jgi:transcriptional regulator with XRE-family HTH domain
MVRLKRERLKRGWSLQTLGFHAGIQGAEISKMERGILVPYPTQRERLARQLGVRPEELMQEADDDDEQ